jgi:hypothetical protein
MGRWKQAGQLGAQVAGDLVEIFTVIWALRALFNRSG